MLNRLPFSYISRTAIAAIISSTLLVVVFVVSAANQTWDGGATGNGTGWTTVTNWVGDTAFAGSTSSTTNTDIASIPSTGSSPNIGINLNVTGNTLYLGAIDFSSASRSIGNSSTTAAGTLQLNGATVNSVANVVLRNSGSGNLTLNAFQSQTMGVALGNATDNVINIDGVGGITISSVISGASKKLTLGGVGTGALTLSGVNTYSGDTTINSGRLVLSGAGSIANSPNIVIAGGATFDVSARTTALTLASGQDLTATGSTSSGTIATASGKGLTLAPDSELVFTAFDPPTAPLTITGAGTVALDGNTVSVNITNGGTPLPTGDHVLISKGTSGGVTGTVNPIPIITGDGVAQTAQVLIVDGQLVLSVSTPTAVRMSNFTATSFNDGVMLEWQSGFEVNNLGYNLYRFENGQRTLVTPSLIAGSALMTRAGNAFRSGFSYGWFDKQGSVGTQYVVEAVDLNGGVDAFAPQYAARGGNRNAPRKDRSMMLTELGATGAGMAAQQGWPAGTADNQSSSELSALAGKQPAATSLKSAKSTNTPPASLSTQHLVASQPGVKFQVRQNGYYRVSQAQLAAAGLNSSANPKFLQLYANGEERPIRVNANGSTLEAGDSVEFYGKGVDALTTDTQTYYLVSGNRPGLRIKADNKKGPEAWVLWTDKTAKTYDYTVEMKERVLYLPGLINGDVDNIFGRPITATPVSQTLPVRDLGGNGSGARLEVILQGYAGAAHHVQVQLNGSYLDTINFDGAANVSTTLSLNPGLLTEGNNTVTLTAAGGQADLSFVDRIRVTYPRIYRAQNDSLNFSVGANTALVTGFSTSAIRVIDITQPSSPRELAPKITQVGNSYQFQISGTRLAGAPRNFIAIADNLIGQPQAVTADQPSDLHSGLGEADMVIVSHGDLRQSVEPLAAWRRSQGMKVSVVDIEDVYDEFSYGSHKPDALRDFLAWAVSHSVKPPRYVLLAGDSSWDPRNYLGQGYHDYVPTKMIGTYELETASDDWLVDFNADGVAELAVGRLPARTAAQINAMVAKIITYDQERALAGPLRGALVVSDTGFETQTANVGSLLASSTTVQTLNRSTIGNDNAMRTQIVDAINQGPAIVNYFGHGSTGVWTGAGLLNRDNASTLTNGSRPSLFVLMTCLNGYSHEVAIDSLAESLMKNSQGGAFAVWASSGQTVPFGQAVMNQQLYQSLFGGQGMRLGDAIQQAKMSTSDLDVRRTWMLFGDPTMKLR